MRNTANTSSAAALIPSMAELSKIGDRHSSDSEPVGLNGPERAVSIDDGSRSNQLPGMVSRRHGKQPWRWFYPERSFAKVPP